MFYFANTSQSNRKIEMVKLFMKWLKLKKSLSNFDRSNPGIEVTYLVSYFNRLLRFLIQYSIVRLSYEKKVEPNNFLPFFKTIQKRSKLKKVFKKI